MRGSGRWRHCAPIIHDWCCCRGWQLRCNTLVAYRCDHLERNYAIYVIISRNRWSVSCFWVRHEKKNGLLSWKFELPQTTGHITLKKPILRMVLVHSLFQSWATTTRSDVTVLERTDTVDQAWCFGYTWERNLKFSSPKSEIAHKPQTLGAWGKVGSGGSVPLILTTDVAAEDGS